MGLARPFAPTTSQVSYLMRTSQVSYLMRDLEVGMLLSHEWIMDSLALGKDKCHQSSLVIDRFTYEVLLELRFNFPARKANK